MLTQSLIKGYGQKRISPRCLTKVDIKKAFDSLQWEFIRKMLQLFNFPLQFQTWIMGYDLMLFVRGDVPSVISVTESLASFAKMSGLHANPEKTNIYMGGIRSNIKQAILNNTGYTEGEFPFRYLGIPLNEGKLNKAMFADLLNKVQKALHHWSNYKLSYAGKISLINSVILGLEQFWCSTLLIPKGVVKFITKYCRNFLWIAEEGHIKLILKSWASCCNPYQEGGFNINEIALGLIGISLIISSQEIFGLWGQRVIILRVEEAFLKLGMSYWTLQGNKLKLRLLYDKFRCMGRLASWATAVWTHAVIPKHSVFAVLAMQQRLATIDQLQKRNILMGVLDWMNLTGRTMCFSKELHWITARKHSRHWKVKWFVSCLSAVVYSLWEEWNLRIFQDL
ncbi:uncharacterized protein LOC141601770 [Silene latifolia]|uniref:uncharacterized protein LOC141601770 n=1 Tax=Silene latifolia TaxID=37657 RepID=UPI003D779FC1